MVVIWIGIFTHSYFPFGSIVEPVGNTFAVPVPSPDFKSPSTCISTFPGASPNPMPITDMNSSALFNVTLCRSAFSLSGTASMQMTCGLTD